MQQLVIATNNQGKLKELQALLPNYRVLTLHDIGFNSEIPEPYETFRENAANKAKTVFAFCRIPTISDDSGICVRSLNGAPGVHSAMFGGEPRSDMKNNQKLLESLKGRSDRSAYYQAVICLVTEDGERYFEGTCNGTIAERPEGTGGFGYDPLFIPEGYDQTFGVLPPEVKKNLSHRAQAVNKLIEYLDQGEKK